jgi:hypothetical protein
MKINAEWHAKHKMPKNPTLEQRVKWHLEHAKHCSCRPIEGKMLEEFKKRYAGTQREFWIFFNVDDHKALGLWAAECAERVLPLFEEKYPKDTRPREAIRVLREWVKTGKFSMMAIRGASLAAHAAAREVKEADNAARYAARAAGQAVATAHVPTHALGPALYAYKAVAATHPEDSKAAIVKEQAWQFKQLPDNLREWAAAGIREKQRTFLRPSLRPTAKRAVKPVVKARKKRARKLKPGKEK